MHPTDKDYFNQRAEQEAQEWRTVANLFFRLTGIRAIPKSMANLNGLKRGGNPNLSPDHNAIGARHG